MGKTPKDFYGRLASTPAPWELDLDAIAEAGWSIHRLRWRQKTETQKRKVVEAWAKGRKRAAIKRRRVAAKRVRADLVARGALRPLRRSQGLLAAVLTAFQPGEWAGYPDIAKRLPAIGRDSLHALFYQKMQRRGYLERGRNAAFRGETIFVKVREPEYLWRLSATGEAARRDAEMFT